MNEVPFEKMKFQSEPDCDYYVYDVVDYYDSPVGLIDPSTGKYRQAKPYEFDTLLEEYEIDGVVENDEYVSEEKFSFYEADNLSLYVKYAMATGNNIYVDKYGNCVELNCSNTVVRPSSFCDRLSDVCLNSMLKSRDAVVVIDDSVECNFDPTSWTFDALNVKIDVRECRNPIIWYELLISSFSAKAAAKHIIDDRDRQLKLCGDVCIDVLNVTDKNSMSKDMIDVYMQSSYDEILDFLKSDIDWYSLSEFYSEYVGNVSIFRENFTGYAESMEVDFNSARNTDYLCAQFGRAIPDDGGWDIGSVAYRTFKNIARVLSFTTQCFDYLDDDYKETYKKFWNNMVNNFLIDY